MVKPGKFAAEARIKNDVAGATIVVGFHDGIARWTGAANVEFVRVDHDRLIIRTSVFGSSRVNHATEGIGIDHESAAVRAKANFRLTNLSDFEIDTAAGT